MAAPPASPCAPWTDEELIRQCCDGLDVGVTGEPLDQVIQFVSAILYRLSGRQYPGECTRIVYPCGSREGGCGRGEFNVNWWWQFYGDFPSMPYPDGEGTWRNFWPCRGKCHLERLKLPATVNSIVAVVIDGEVLDPTAYKIEAYRWLVRTDGGRWPCTNAFGEPGDDGTFTVEYSYGKPVPPDGQYAASLFACEVAKNRCGADNCLPARLKTVTRQGVTMTFPDPLEFLDDGQVGIYEVDMWIRSVNPSKLKRRARIHRPDATSTNRTFT